MYCQKCGTGIEGSYKFCKSCGFNLSQQTTSSHDTHTEPVQAKSAKAENSICPVCNAAIMAGSAFVACSACGIKYHPECWKTNLGCSTYGCPMVGSLKPRNGKIISDSGKPIKTQPAEPAKPKKPMKKSSFTFIGRFFITLIACGVLIGMIHTATKNIIGFEIPSPILSVFFVIGVIIAIIIAASGNSLYPDDFFK